MEMSHIDGECQVFSSIPIGNSTGTWLLWTVLYNTTNEKYYQAKGYLY
jgi:hypothetical protein